MNTRILCLCSAAALLLVACRNAEGRFRPPDPIGYAIFEALDRGPQNPRGRDAEYIGQGSDLPARGYPPSPSSVWVDGTWGTSNGQRVWIPAHWQ